MLSHLPIKIGASPLNWYFGLPLPQKEIPTADQILGEMKETGYAGTELGSVIPSNPAQLEPLLKQHDIELAGGWFGCKLLSKPFAEEKERFIEFMLNLKRMGCSTVVIAETTHVPIGLPYADHPHRDVLADNLFPYSLPFLRDHEWTKLAEGLEEFYNLAEAQNMRLAYHPHMQTLVQDLMQIERLMEEAPFLTFCMDTGHLYFAGMDPYRVIQKYIDKIVHIHFKNVRPDIIARARREPMPWMWSKIEGAFTVPGDGGIDFLPIVGILAENEWAGWIIVEAEQNPQTANPYVYATLAREFLKDITGL